MDDDIRALGATSGEKWLRALVDGMPQMIWRAVDLGCWTWSSPQWQGYTGLTSSASEGWGWLEAVHPDDRAIARESWEQAPSLDEFHADLRILGRNGRYKWFQTRGEPYRDDAGMVLEWIGTSTDVDDLRQLQSEQKVLVAELQHRARNLIAVVHSICTQTVQRSSSIEDFQERFEDRLSALSRVQGLLSMSEHEPITIGRLLDLELKALAATRITEQVEMWGPKTIVRTSTAQTLALAVHELTTNAIKYGALSTSAGRLAVNWFEHDRDGHPWLCLDWRESGSPPNQPSSGSGGGYGRLLIERALPRQLGAQTKLTFRSGSMECIIDLPLKHARRADVNE